MADIQMGRYYGGHQYGIIPTGGYVDVTTTTPSSEVHGGDMIHGAMHVTTLGPYPSGVGPNLQGYDARTDDFGGNGPIPYSAALNVDPGANGDAAHRISEPCVLIKAWGKTDVEAAGARQFLFGRFPVFFIDHTPATDALPPPLGATPLVSRYVKNDLNMANLPSLPVVPGGPPASSLVNSLRWLNLDEFSLRPRGDYYTGGKYENFYASDNAPVYANAAMALCCNIDANYKELLAVHMVTRAQNIVQALNSGALFNTNTGLGGILAGYKTAVVVAYILTGDSYFGDWASRTDWAAEDRQSLYVPQEWVDTYDYIQDDLNMPEWSQNPIYEPTKITRVVPAAYEGVYLRHSIGMSIAMMCLGGVSVWNNGAVFDFSDRVMERTLYKDPGSTYQWARTMTGTNSPSAYHKDFWDATRRGAGMPQVWDWPA